ncbi:MAG: tRNA pseudouridine(55) synthase TruB [Ignavibacteriales bacterium]|nr:MAG: tRNA pseudouridine(55) synthase TruB [Ignavibacteriales bacterium]
MITKETVDQYSPDFTSGEIILIDKPLRWTSFKVVHKIRKAAGVKKVGHAGTLDPLATGLLIVCTGRKTKEIISFQDLEKKYTGTITLGKTSPSMDLETEVTDHIGLDGIEAEKIIKVKENFVGRIMQKPPMYSALKVGGKTLYKMARKGKTVERDEREVVVSEFNVTGINLPDINFEIRCSKGTYIRVIANDLGERLGCGGILSSLRRTEIGDFSVNSALTMEEFNKHFLTINA